MINKICMQTPAGEKHAIEIDDKGAAPHACHTGLRIGVAQMMHWIDGHVNWQRPDKPEIKTPFHGDGDWLIAMHPNDRTCVICVSRDQ